MSAKERKVAEQMEGNRYVGIQIALGHGRQGETGKDRWRSSKEALPTARAQGQRPDRESRWHATKGMHLREVVNRLRGDEGTDVTVMVRQPKAKESRTLK